MIAIGALVLAGRTRPRPQMRRRWLPLALVVSLGSGVAVPALAATTVPVLWEAGGLDAGNTGAGQAARIASDSAGNIGIVSGLAGGRDLAVTSYTADGTFRWRRTISPSAGTFLGDWVAAAPNGDFVAVGHSVNSTGASIAIAMVRYSTDGTFLWRVDLARTRPGVGRLLVDSGGNTFLAFNSIGDGQDIQLHKYSPAGVLLWSALVSTGPLSNNIATSLALSPDGADVVLTGDTLGGAEWITALHDASTGTRRWLVTAAEGVATTDVVMDSGRVYVTGQGNVGITGLLTVVAYDRATGARLWRTDRKPVDGTSAAGLRMDITPDGNLVVTGQANRGFLDWYTVSLSTTGAVRWEAVRDGGLNTDEIPRAVLVRADGTSVVTGTGGPALPGGFIQGVTAGYGPDGTLLWEAFSRFATVWAIDLPNSDVCTTGGYDAYVSCFRVSDGGTNQPPIAAIAATPARGTAPLTVTFDATSSFDPDGSVTSWTWSFGDGSSGTGPTVQHVYAVRGTYLATVTVTDDAGGSDTESVVITVRRARAGAAAALPTTRSVA